MMKFESQEVRDHKKKFRFFIDDLMKWAKRSVRNQEILLEMTYHKHQWGIA